jgi:hypothetical protein
MERCPRDDLKRQQFLVFPDQEKTGLAPSCPAGVARDRKDEKNSLNGGDGEYTGSKPGKQNGNPG